MLIELTENDCKHSINVPHCGTKKNSFLFLMMLNHFDPFVHVHPSWWNKTLWRNTLDMACESATMAEGFPVQFADISTNPLVKEARR